MSFRFRALLTIAFVALAMFTVDWQYERSREKTLTIAAGPVDGEAFGLASAIAEVVHRYNPGIRIVVLETRGSRQDMELLGTGRAQLAAVQADTRAAAGARLVAPLYPDAFQLVVRDESGIESVADLRGRKIALPPRGGGQYDTYWFLAEHYGLDADDFVALPMDTEAADFAMMVGAVDAVFRVRAPGNASIQALIANIPTHLVPIDQAAAMRLKQPALQLGSIPKGSYRGYPPLPEDDLPTAAVQRLLIASSDVDEDIVATITMTLFERRRDLLGITPLAGFVSSPDQTSGTFLPLHSGARRYYDREKPSFVQENAEPIALLFSFLVIAGSGLLRLATQRRKNRLDEYNRQLLVVWKEAEVTDDRGHLLQQRETLMGVLGKVVDDAEEGRITAEGFNIFSFTWEAVYESIRDKLLIGHREARG